MQIPYKVKIPLKIIKAFKHGYNLINKFIAFSLSQL